MEELDRTLQLTALMQSNQLGREFLSGYWIFDQQRRAFLLDRQSAHLLGVDYTGDWVDLDSMLTLYDPLCNERFMHILSTVGGSDEIIEELSVIKGPKQGTVLLARGSVVKRDDKGAVLILSGSLKPMQQRSGARIGRDLKREGNWEWDGLTGRVTFSIGYRAMLGYAPHEPFYENFKDWAREVVHPEDVTSTVDEQLQILKSPDKGDYFECALRLKHKDGHYIWTIGRGLVLQRDAAGKALRLAGTNTDISLVAASLTTAQDRIYRDALTGLYNREYLHAQQEQWTEVSQQPLSLIYADVTGLKLINDYLGHQEGDELLKDAAQLLQTSIQRRHIVIRAGGDEFMVVMPRCSDVQCSLLIKTMEAFMEQSRCVQSKPPLFIELGAAVLMEVPNDSFAQLMDRADQRMQQVKQKSRPEHQRQLKEWLERRLGRSISLHDDRL